MTSLRDQLARKRAHSTSLTFPLGEAGERAKSAFDEAQARLNAVQLMGTKYPDALKEAQAAFRKARTAYAKNSLTIEFRGLTAEERDTLTSAHPVTPEIEAADKDKPKEERREVDVAGFLPPALAIGALDSDLSEADWAAELASDRWTAGERNALFAAVVTATNQEPSPGIPKD